MTNTEQRNIIVKQAADQIRLDKVLAIELPEFSRARLQALIKDKQVLINGKVAKAASFKISVGDTISVSIPEAVDADPEPENIPLNIIYEDDDLLVINKAADMVVHPAVGNLSGTLVNALLHHCKDSLSGIGGVKRPGIVHRLDKETSGLMIVAKNDEAHQGLSSQLKDRTLGRIYQAFVWRVPHLIKGYVDEPIGRHATNRLKMAIMKSSGREAKTDYLVQEKYGNAAANVQCKLESGRTHQIRVHMMHIKHPVIGDPLYGLARQESTALLEKSGYEDDILTQILNFPRQALHACEIHFIHPKTGEEMVFLADMPSDMQNLENCLKSVL